MLAAPVSLHTLQTVGCTAKTEAGTIAAGDLRFDGEALTGETGQHVTFDGIFGAFFEGYWARHTGVDDLALVLELTGHIEITIERVASSTGQTERALQSELQGTGERLIVPVPMVTAGETRLILTIRLVSTSKITAIAWTTRRAPTRSVGLMAVICTFNREKDVAATLDELLLSPCGLRRVLVVNQGQAGLALRLQHLRSAQDAGTLRVIDQANLGGAGGFGRGMLESLSDDECSHVLLMDDDIDLDADTIRRLVVILSYLKSDHAIGGAMIDRTSRTRLFSVGDVVDRKRPEIRNLVDPAADDITQAATSRYLALHHHPDFNGWWFFAFAKQDIERFGLPLPLFIRGDDVEYGYRLSVNGTRTLGWPGLAVWHEPFHAKRQPWHYFYDRRNSLFLCEAHGRLGRIRLFGALLTGFLNHLLRFDYDRASCVTLGLAAFNDGPERLARWDGNDHSRLAEAFGSKELPQPEGGISASVPRSRVPTPLLFAGRLMKDLLRRTTTGGEAATLPARHWRPIVQHRPTPVKIHYQDSGTAAEFHHDRDRTRACSKAFARESFRFLFRAWQPDPLMALTRRDFWTGYTSQLASRR